MSRKELDVYSRFLREVQSFKDNPNQGLGTRIEELATSQPNNVALFFQDANWTFQSLNAESNRFAHFFRKLGLKPGETVALMIENSPDFLFCMIGLNKIQAISALINFHQKKQALAHSFKIADPTFIVVDGDCLPAFKEIASELACKNGKIFVVNNPQKITHDYIDLSSKLKPESPLNPATTYDSTMKQTALYIYTAGTTGLPKAVIMQHFKLFSQGAIIGRAVAQLTPADTVYIVTPLYHNLAIGTAWMAAILTGASVALRRQFSASGFWQDVRKYHVTFTMYIGEIPRYLLNQPVSELEKNQPLKKMAGLGLRKDIWEQFKSRFGIEHIWEFYGSTEGHRPFFNMDEVPGMIGRNNMPGIVLAKVDPETGEFYKGAQGFFVKCNPGDTGMILIKVEKDDIFTGYKDKAKTNEKLIHNCFREGDAYFNSGDMLKLHEHQWVSFADRFGDTFRWKGENVSTLEIEEILNSYEAIELSAVYGVPIPNTEGKAGMAAIKLNHTIKFDLSDFSRFITEVLPPYSIPLFLRIRKKFEFTGPLKLTKVNLRKDAYNLDTILDPLYFWDVTAKRYKPLTKSEYQQIVAGHFKL
ncbi:MAG: long-chain-acyl-CoA synthetase [Candidatus Helarchaeota archaeon]|nr:long-chain-acyl-CoA synthetase [Candidatus Helarchaeota archaeon]